MAQTKGGGPNPNKNIAQAEAILNSGGDTSKFNAATWQKLKEIERANALRNYNPAGVMDGYTPPPSGGSKPVTQTPSSNPSTQVSSPTSGSTVKIAAASPILPNFKPIVSNKNFKVAPSDIIQFDDNSVEIELIKDLLFEDIGATELANISRTDLIDGQNVIYAPIKNLPVIRRDFNPNNIVATGSNSDYFSRFAIDLSLRGIYDPYFDDQGNLVIEVETVGDDEEIQVQILTNGTIALVDDI